MRPPDPEELMRQIQEMGLSDEVRKLLEDAAAGVSPKSASPPTELFSAVERSDWDTVIECLRVGADPNETRQLPHNDGETVLGAAVQVGEPKTVQTLIEHGADPHYLTAHGYSALIDACHGRVIRTDSNLLELVSVLLDAGVNPNLISSFGESALSVLSRVGRFDVVNLILERGGDPSQLGWGPLSKAVAVGTIDDVRRELSAPNDIEETDRWERTPFLLALIAGDDVKAELLLESGANIDALGRCRSPALHFAIDSYNVVVVRWLLSQAVDLTSTDEFDQGALDWAAEAGEVSILSLLLDHFSNQPRVAELRDEALSRADTKATAMTLLSAGADPQNLDIETRCAVLGSEYMGDAPWSSVTREDYNAGRDPRFGSANPELVHEPFWDAMIKTRVSGYAGSIRFEERHFACGEARPVWSAHRFGQSLTFLPDGRVVEIGGEHEDWYDPDFRIYNDVIVHETDGSIKTYIYPEAVFPCTDFHTATLAGGRIYIIGGLRYEKDRMSRIDVYKLDTNTFQIEKLRTAGEVPPYIFRHKARLVDDAIEIFGGEIGSVDAPNSTSYKLDIASAVWSRSC